MRQLADESVGHAGFPEAGGRRFAAGAIFANSGGQLLTI
jgi:hypothetical protein